jgi:hypothetical protein
VKEGSTPVTAYKTGAETVPMGEMGGDEGKDIHRDAVYANEGVPPLVDSRQRGRGILGEFGNLVEGETVVEVSGSFLKTSRARPQ